jgi:hypothetical protein
MLYGDPEHEGKHEFNFAEQLYKPGGIDAVANNLREHQARSTEASTLTGHRISCSRR